jgi:hypothetical protein
MPLCGIKSNKTLLKDNTAAHALGTNGHEHGREGSVVGKRHAGGPCPSLLCHYLDGVSGSERYSWLGLALLGLALLGLALLGLELLCHYLDSVRRSERDSWLGLALMAGEIVQQAISYKSQHSYSR